jgi:hypothetical protein
MVNAMPPSTPVAMPMPRATPVTNNAASIMSANKLFQRRKSNP